MDVRVDAVLKALKRRGSARVRQEMLTRYGIVAPKAFGVPMAGMRQIANRCHGRTGMTTGMRNVGDFCWINMLTPRPAEARAFFGTLLGWSYGEMPGMGHVVRVGRLCGITSPQGITFYVITYTR